VTIYTDVSMYSTYRNQAELDNFETSGKEGVHF